LIIFYRLLFAINLNFRFSFKIEKMNEIIPKELSNWDINTINQLINLPHIESETFDFKGYQFQGFDELYADICGMANVSGGHVVLGINEIKDNEGRLLKFKKNGFKLSKHKNDVENRINDAIAEIEPLLKVEKRIVDDGEFFYPILKIIPDEMNRPYFARKNCYIRVNSSSPHASRNIVMNLFHNLIQKRNDIQKLKVCVNVLIEEINFTSKKIASLDINNKYERIIPINLEYLENTILSTDWFFLENNLYGGHISDTMIRSGLYTNLNKIKGLNLHIDFYNREYGVQNRQQIKEIISFWKPGSDEVSNILKYFKDIKSKCEEFLNSF
jgi:Putative DNA-binding domain